MNNNPPPVPPPFPDPVRVEQGDNTGGLIPYKNPQALTAYYLGLFSIIPVLGFFLACASVPLGIAGLKKRKANPIVRGAAHAWIGIIGGSFSILIHLLIVGLVIVANLSKHR